MSYFKLINTDSELIVVDSITPDKDLSRLLAERSESKKLNILSNLLGLTPTPNKINLYDQISKKHIEGVSKPCCLQGFVPEKCAQVLLTTIMNETDITKMNSCFLNNTLTCLRSWPINSKLSKYLTQRCNNFRHDYFAVYFMTHNHPEIGLESFDQPLANLGIVTNNTPDIIIRNDLDVKILEFAVSISGKTAQKKKGTVNDSKYQNDIQALRNLGFNVKYYPIILQLDITAAKNNENFKSMGYNFDCSYIYNELNEYTQQLFKIGHVYTPEDNTFKDVKHSYLIDCLNDKTVYFNFSGTDKATIIKNRKFDILNQIRTFQNLGTGMNISFDIKREAVTVFKDNDSNFSGNDLITLLNQSLDDEGKMQLLLENSKTINVSDQSELKPIVPIFTEYGPIFFKHNNAKLVDQSYTLNELIVDLDCNIPDFEGDNMSYGEEVVIYFDDFYLNQKTYLKDFNGTYNKMMDLIEKDPENVKHLIDSNLHSTPETRRNIVTEFDNAIRIENSVRSKGSDLKNDYGFKPKSAFLAFLFSQKFNLKHTITNEDLIFFQDLLNYSNPNVIHDFQNLNTEHISNLKKMPTAIRSLSNDNKVRMHYEDLTINYNLKRSEIINSDDYQKHIAEGKKWKQFDSVGKQECVKLEKEMREINDKCNKAFKGDKRVNIPVTQTLKKEIKEESTRDYNSKGYQGTGKYVRTDIPWDDEKICEEYKGLFDDILNKDYSNLHPNRFSFNTFFDSDKGNNQTYINNFKRDVNERMSDLRSYLDDCDLGSSLEFNHRLAKSILFLSNISLRNKEIAFDNLGLKDTLLLVNGGGFGKETSRLFKLILPMEEKYSKFYTCFGQSGSWKTVNFRGKVFLITPWLRYNTDIINHMFYLKYKIFNMFFVLMEECGFKTLEGNNKYLFLLPFVLAFNARRKLEERMSGMRQMVSNFRAMYSSVAENMKKTTTYAKDYTDYFVQIYMLKIFKRLSEDRDVIREPIGGIDYRDPKQWTVILYASRIMPKAPFNFKTESRNAIKSWIETYKETGVNKDSKPEDYDFDNKDNKWESIYDHDLLYSSEFNIMAGHFLGDYLASTGALANIFRDIASIYSKNVFSIANNNGSLGDEQGEYIETSLDRRLKQLHEDIQVMEVLKQTVAKEKHDEVHIDTSFVIRSMPEQLRIKYPQLDLKEQKMYFKRFSDRLKKRATKMSSRMISETLSGDKKKRTGKKGYKATLELFTPDNLDDVVLALEAPGSVAVDKILTKKEERLFNVAKTLIRTDDLKMTFKINPKKQWGGGRETFNMSSATKIIQQIPELIFAQIAKALPNELIHYSSDSRSLVLNNFIHEKFDKFSYFLSYDYRRWAPFANFGKYRNFIKGLCNHLPPSFLSYFDLVCDKMEEKVVLLTDEDLLALCRQTDTLEIFRRQGISFYHGYCLVKFMHSFVMGIFNYLSSILHATVQLLFRHLLQNSKIVKDPNNERYDPIAEFIGMAHSDDMQGIIKSKDTKSLEFIAAKYEDFNKYFNHMQSNKKSQICNQSTEIISIVRIDGNVVSMIAKQCTGFLISPSYSGYEIECNNLKSKVIEVIQNGGTFSQAYCVYKTHVYCLSRDIYQLANPRFDLPIALLGQPDETPQEMMIFGKLSNILNVFKGDFNKYIRYSQFLSSLGYGNLINKTIHYKSNTKNSLLAFTDAQFERLTQNYTPEVKEKMLGLFKSETLVRNNVKGNSLNTMQVLAKLHDSNFSAAMSGGREVEDLIYLLKNCSTRCYQLNQESMVPYKFRDSLSELFSNFEGKDPIDVTGSSKKLSYVDLIKNNLFRYKQFISLPDSKNKIETNIQLKPALISLQGSISAGLDQIAEGKYITHIKEPEYEKLLNFSADTDELFQLFDNSTEGLNVNEKLEFANQILNSKTKPMYIYAHVRSDQRRIETGDDLLSYLAYNTYRGLFLSDLPRQYYTLYSLQSSTNTELACSILLDELRNVILPENRKEFCENYKVRLSDNNLVTLKQLYEIQQKESRANLKSNIYLRSYRDFNGIYINYKNLNLPIMIWIKSQIKKMDNYVGNGTLICYTSNSKFEINVRGNKIIEIFANNNFILSDLIYFVDQIVSMGFQHPFLNKVLSVKNTENFKLSFDSVQSLEPILTRKDHLTFCYPDLKIKKFNNVTFNIIQDYVGSPSRITALCSDQKTYTGVIYYENFHTEPINKQLFFVKDNKSLLFKLAQINDYFVINKNRVSSLREEVNFMNIDRLEITPLLDNIKQKPDVLMVELKNDHGIVAVSEPGLNNGLAENIMKFIPNKIRTDPLGSAYSKFADMEGQSVYDDVFAWKKREYRSFSKFGGKFDNSYALSVFGKNINADVRAMINLQDHLQLYSYKIFIKDIMTKSFDHYWIIEFIRFSGILSDLLGSSQSCLDLLIKNQNIFIKGSVLTPAKIRLLELIDFAVDNDEIYERLTTSGGVLQYLPKMKHQTKILLLQLSINGLRHICNFYEDVRAKTFIRNPGASETIAKRSVDKAVKSELQSITAYDMVFNLSNDYPQLQRFMEAKENFVKLYLKKKEKHSSISMYDYCTYSKPLNKPENSLKEGSTLNLYVNKLSKRIIDDETILEEADLKWHQFARNIDYALSSHLSCNNIIGKPDLDDLSTLEDPDCFITMEEQTDKIIYMDSNNKYVEAISRYLVSDANCFSWLSVNNNQFDTALHLLSGCKLYVMEGHVNVLSENINFSNNNLVLAELDHETLQKYSSYLLVWMDADGNVFFDQPPEDVSDIKVNIDETLVEILKAELFDGGRNIATKLLAKASGVDEEVFKKVTDRICSNFTAINKRSQIYEPEIIANAGYKITDDKIHLLLKSIFGDNLNSILQGRLIFDKNEIETEFKNNLKLWLTKKKNCENLIKIFEFEKEHPNIKLNMNFETTYSEERRNLEICNKAINYSSAIYKLLCNSSTLIKTGSRYNKFTNNKSSKVLADILNRLNSNTENIAFKDEEDILNQMVDDVTNNEIIKSSDSAFFIDLNVKVDYAKQEWDDSD